MQPLLPFGDVTFSWVWLILIAMAFFGGMYCAFAGIKFRTFLLILFVFIAICAICNLRAIGVI